MPHPAPSESPAATRAAVLALTALAGYVTLLAAALLVDDGDTALVLAMLSVVLLGVFGTLAIVTRRGADPDDKGEEAPR